MPNNKDRIAKLNKIIFGTEVQEDLEEAKKKKKKKKKTPKVTYTTGFPFLNDHRFNHAFGTCDCGKDAADDINDAISGGEAAGEGSGDGSLGGDIGGEGGAMGESLSLKEALNYTNIKNILNDLWNKRQGTEGIIATIDTSGNVSDLIAKWAESKTANFVHLSGLNEFDLDVEVPDDDNVSAGEDLTSLDEVLKKAKTVVLISDYLKADASTRARYLKLFARKNIYFIIVPGLALEIGRIPEGEKAKFMHKISFLDKDVKEQPAKAAEANNPVYDYAGAEAVGEVKESIITEAKREVRRYYIRPQNIFCANKAEIIKALIDIGDQNCSVYTLKYLGPEKDINKLTAKDIIYYYDNEILYDKNHVKVMDYDLYIKHEEERQKFSGDIEDVPEEKFNDEYEDRIHQDTVLEDIDIFNQDFVDVDALGEAKEQKFVCCICGEPSEGYGNNPSPYKEKGRCCDSCNLKFVIPARYDEWQAEYSWPTLEEPDEVE
jgi:hypothetical protein